MKDGLPYQEVVDVFCTSKGVLWVRAASGEWVSRFDGINWEHFNMAEEGMPPYMNLLSEDADSNLWLTYRDIDQTLLARYRPLSGFTTYAFPAGVFCDITAAGKLYCHDTTATYFAWYAPEQDAFVRSPDPPYVNLPGFFFEYAILTAAGDIVLRYINTGTGEARYFWNDRELAAVPGAAHAIPMHVFDRDDVVCLDLQKPGYFRFAQGRRQEVPVRLSDGRRLVPLYPVRLRAGPYRRVRSGRALVCAEPESGKLFLAHIGSDGMPEILLSWLPDEGIHAATQDLAGNWWLATNNGLLYVKPALLTFDDRQPGMVKGLFSIGQDEQGRIWMGGHEGVGGFSVFDGLVLRYERFGRPSLKILPGSVRGPSGHLFFSTASAPRSILSIHRGRVRFQQYAKDGIPLSAFYFTMLRDSQIAIGSVNLGLVLARDSSGWLTDIRVIDEDRGLRMNDVGTVAEDARGRLWLGRLSAGLALYDPAADTVVNWPRVPGNPHTLGIMSTCMDETGRLWLGTHDGLYFLDNAHTFDYRTDTPWTHLKPQPLPGNDRSVVHSLQRTERFLSIGTERAVYLLDKKYTGNPPRIFTLEFGKDIHGGGAEQNAVWYDPGGFLWLGTQKGATCLDLHRLVFDTLPTPVHLQEMRAGGEPFPISGHQLGKLPCNKRAIAFSLFAPGNQFLRNDLKFDVLVVHDRRDTIFYVHQTEEKTFSIPYLPPGSYRLQLTVWKHNVVVGNNAYAFEVPWLWTERPEVYGIIMTVLVGVFAWLYIQHNRHQLELATALRERDSLRTLALSNFFNPHFINNALHWIQSRYRKDPDTVTIIGRLSDNVHILYENTQRQRPYHSLERELEVVRNYLRIQQIRFGEALQITWDIEPDAAARKAIRVPAMLLQIHVENAVEKGIRNRKGAGRLRLEIRCDDAGCHIAIEDDGRGRTHTGSARKGSTFVMNELIQLFNRYNTHPITVAYEDFIFGDHGTRVRIFIPKNFSYELSQTENAGR